MKRHYGTTGRLSLIELAGLAMLQACGTWADRKCLELGRVEANLSGGEMTLFRKYHRREELFEKFQSVSGIDGTHAYGLYETQINLPMITRR